MKTLQSKLVKKIQGFKKGNGKEKGRVDPVSLCLEELEKRVLLSLGVTNLNTLTPEQLAQMLVGTGVIVSDVTFTGATIAGGAFTNGLTEGLGINRGVILSTGDVSQAAGPNVEDWVSGYNEKPGDADLTALIPGYETYDAAVLEFDFIPEESTLTFQYVFGSEEYNEYAPGGEYGADYNDVFGFFVNGENIALIPGTTTPVAIHTINQTVNAEYFCNNDMSDLGTPTPYPTQFDGFTKVLQASVNVEPGVKTHIKLAIADGGDDNFDSAIFLGESSFVSGSADVGVTQTVSKASVKAGQSFMYTITATNHSGIPATGVVIADQLVSGVVYIGSSVSQGSVAATAGGAVTASVGTLGPGQSVTLNITAKSPTVGTYANTATVTANEFDAVPGNNSATKTVKVNDGSSKPKVQGTVYSDNNNNNTQDSGESGMGNVVVFIDTNNNGIPDADEPTTVTETDNVLTEEDETGDYVFEGVEEGDHVVDEVVPDGYTPTLPSEVTVTEDEDTAEKDFGNVPEPSYEVQANWIFYQDTDGSNVQVKLTKGTCSVFFTGQDVQQTTVKNKIYVSGTNLEIAGIELHGTSEKSSLSVKVKGGSDGQSVLGDLSGSALGKFNGKDTVLEGTIDFSGMIKNLTAAKLDGCSIRAGAIATLQVKSDMMDSVVSSGGDIKKVVVKGDMVDSSIFAGYDIGVDGLVGGTDDQAGSGNIASVKGKGLFSGSYLTAGGIVSPNDSVNSLTGSIGKVQFGSLNLDNGQVTFGVFARTAIKSVKIGKERFTPDYTQQPDFAIVLID